MGETRALQAPQTAAPAGGLAKLILIDNWTGTLGVIVLATVVSFLLFGYWWPYWRIADMDFWMIYEAWLFNDRLPQEWFDHPGYLSILLLGGWFRLLHDIGLLSVHALSEVPADPAGADLAWNAAARAGRVLSLLLATGYLTGFAYLLRRIIGDWRVAVLAAFVLAFSGGFAMNERIIRTELIAGGGVIIALLLLMIAARRRSLAAGAAWAPVLVGLAAFAATLGFINKVQVIFLICALPLMVVPFGERRDDDEFWRNARRALSINAALAACAALIAMPAVRLFVQGLSQAASAGWQPFLLNTFGAYQAAIAVWIVASIILFAVWWRVGAAETFATMMCVVIGVALGFLALDIRPNPGNVLVVANPLEQLLSWAKTSDPQSGSIIAFLVDGFTVVARTRTFVLDTSARPTIFLEWLVIAATIFAWRAGYRALALQATVFLCVVWDVDATSAARGLKQQYFILTDPLVVIAAALLIAGVPALRSHRYAFGIGMVLLAVHVAVSQAEPVKHTFLTNKPMWFCVEHFGYTKRIKLFPYCPQPAS